jgi:hypothetical protein
MLCIGHVPRGRPTMSHFCYYGTLANYIPIPLYRCLSHGELASNFSSTLRDSSATRDSPAPHATLPFFAAEQPLPLLCEQVSLAPCCVSTMMEKEERRPGRSPLPL